MNENLESNKWKLSAISVLRWFLLIVPIIVPFYQQNGLSMGEVFFVQAAFSVTIVLLEVPSGYFADKFGRKLSIVLGCIGGFIGLLMYSFSYNFAGLIIAEIICGIGFSFISGADSALLYDSLIEAKKQKDYMKIQGQISSFENFSEGVASIIGGFLAIISLRTPFYIQTILTFFMIPIALSLAEPKKHIHKSSVLDIKSIKQIVKYSLHENVSVKWLIIYSALVSASTMVMVWFTQPYWEQIGVPLILFGLLWAIFSFSCGIFTMYAYKFEAFWGKKKSLISLIILSSLGFFALSLFPFIWAIPLLLIFYFVRGINEPISKDYVNSLVSSDIRATILSVKNLVFRLIFSIIGPIVGWINDLYSLKIALMLSGLIFLFFGIVSLLFLRKHHAL